MQNRLVKTFVERGELERAAGVCVLWVIEFDSQLEEARYEKSLDCRTAELQN